MVGPTFTLAKTGNVVQASTSLSSSYAANKIKDTYIGDLSVEKICPTVHSAEINQIFLLPTHSRVHFPKATLYLLILTLKNLALTIQTQLV